MSSEQLTSLASTSPSACRPLTSRAHAAELDRSPVAPRHVGNLLQRTARRIVANHLEQISRDQLLLEEPGNTRRFGVSHVPELSGHLRIRSPAFFTRAVRHGALGVAESYLAGEWDSADLTEFFRVMLRNEQVLTRLKSWLTAAAGVGTRLQHALRSNSRYGSRRNIREHYDLGNEFFRLFLDDTMMYSAAVFPSPECDLRSASLHKLDLVCRTLELCPADHVIEIGTGWGGFAEHAATRFGCRVTTTTISDEQFQYARQRIADAGLSERVTVLRQDYRDLTGRYDKLVSIEMIEAVGRRYLPEFFRVCHQLLRPAGSMLIQAITMPEQRHARYAGSVDFIQKYIFPGGYLPSVTELQLCASCGTSLRLLNLRDFGLDYARTLSHWNARFHTQLDRVRQLGFSERFIRMWRYYLCYCEAAFLERATGVVQAVWATPGSPLMPDAGQ